MPAYVGTAALNTFLDERRMQNCSFLAAGSFFAQSHFRRIAQEPVTGSRADGKLSYIFPTSPL